MKSGSKIVAVTLSTVLMAAAGMAMSDDDDHVMDSVRSWFDLTALGIAPIESKLYMEECGSCHFPYHPGLLPAISWEKVMTGLDDHFGENAEIDAGDLATIQNFLLNNAAGRVNYGLPNKLMASQRGHPAPIRVTEMRYFVYEHSELPRKVVQDNPQVKSFSNCDSCHTKAKRGDFDDDDVRIPGFGYWDD
ncbi:MAG: cytochrome C [Gammaproteobacteria bacterium]|nr:cytochrome C [Gammaproteobacteria bacterium]